MSFFNCSGLNSPPRRPLIFPSPTSPFCTSPSQLAEVTLDEDTLFSNSSAALRQVGGPMGGRSVKDYVDQLSLLKKENFGLKLRIYFLEERMGSSFKLDKEEIIKKNVELMVELQSTKKELDEKHDLLCQAVAAMELEDDEHKKALEAKDNELANSADEIRSLNAHLEDIKSRGIQDEEIELRNHGTMQEFVEKLKSLEEELFQEREHNDAIQLILSQNDIKVQGLSQEMEELKEQLEIKSDKILESSSQIEDLEMKCNSLHLQLQERDHLVNGLNAENQDLKKRYIDVDKDRRRLEKLKIMSEQKSAELQCKLENCFAELKKSQELVVPRSGGFLHRKSDNGSFSVSESTTPSGSPKKDEFLFPATPSPLVSPNVSTSSSASFSSNFQFPEKCTDLKVVLEQMKIDREAQHKKIAKLKGEQIKACKIIKGMIDSNKKLNQEKDELKAKNEYLERQIGGKTADESSMDAELMEKYKSLANDLEQKNELLSTTLLEKDKQVKELQKRYEELEQQEKENYEHIVALEFELSREKPETEGVFVKELKEKDEEIDRLNSKLQKRNFDLQGLVNHELWDKNREIEKLQRRQGPSDYSSQLQIKEKQLELIKEKISDLGIDIDIQDNQINIDNHLQNELEKSEKLREEANEICRIMGQRLEELAVFLDSLLRQKLVLGFLGSNEKRLRQIVDQSLDLSRSFNISVMNSEQSLLQLSNLSSILNQTQGEKMSLTYRSHLHCDENPEIIEALREQIVNLKYQLQLRDVELGKIITEQVSSSRDEKAILHTSTTLKQQSHQHSESESWSEPDRDVSRARIGLKNLEKSGNSTDSSDDESHKNHSFTIHELQKQLTDSIAVNQNLEAEVMILREKKCDAETKIEELEKEKGELIQQFTIKDKTITDKINQIEVEKMEAINMAEYARSELKSAEIKLNTMHVEINNLNEALSKTNQENDRVLRMQDFSNIEIQKLQSTIEDLQFEYSRNYVRKCDVEETLAECVRLKAEIVSLEDQLDETSERHEQVKKKIEDCVQEINELRGELDNATLQYSEAVLDKTKIASEKALLEQDLNRACLREIDLKKQFDEVQQQLCGTKHTYTKQVSTLEDTKSHLEVRISELESSNAELHNRLIKIQTGCGDHLATSSNFVNQIVSFRRQHSENSGGYLSEEHYVVENRLGAPIDLERHEANSSPDLGIESDHGRFSSLETHLNVPRPLLSTLELTESMSNLLDMEQVQIQDGCENSHCCRRTLELSQENTELKHKLIRARKAWADTASQLTLANQRKKNVEKTICRQIHKTSQVLRKAKANLDSGSETDLLKK